MTKPTIAFFEHLRDTGPDLDADFLREAIIPMAGCSWRLRSASILVQSDTNVPRHVQRIAARETFAQDAHRAASPNLDHLTRHILHGLVE